MWWWRTLLFLSSVRDGVLIKCGATGPIYLVSTWFAVPKMDIGLLTEVLTYTVFNFNP